MKKIVTIIMLVSLGFLFADGLSINTPGGSFSMTVNDNSVSANVKSHSVTVEQLISDIADDMENIESFHKKLNRFDQKKCQAIMDGCYDKLAVIPSEGSVNITTSGTSSDGNVSINFSVNENSVSANVSSNTVTVDYLISDIANELEKVEKYHRKLKKFDQRKCQTVMDDIYSKLAVLPTDGTVTLTSTSSSNNVSDANVNIIFNVSADEAVEPRPKPVKHERVPMGSVDFNDWKRRIEDESFADDQLRIVKMGARNVWLKCNQVESVLTLFSFANDQLAALRVMWPRVVDKQNNYKVLDSFDFSSDKSSAESIMN
jgi:hypothetical protein